MGVDAVMFVKPEREYTESEVRDLSYEIASAFGAEKFFIIRPNEFEGIKGRHALELVKFGKVKHCFACQTLYKDDDFLIEVNICSRCYREGYERGNLPLILAVSNWLSKRLRGEVWYGGDDEYVDLLTEEVREKLWNHFCKVGHLPYYRSPFGERGNPVCSFCGGKEMFEFGCSKGDNLYFCPGCGLKVVKKTKTGRVVQIEDVY